VTWSDTDENPLTEWVMEVQLAPILRLINPSGFQIPVGNYYVNIMDWDAGIDFNYTFTLDILMDQSRPLPEHFRTDKSIYTNDP